MIALEETGAAVKPPRTESAIQPNVVCRLRYSGCIIRWIRIINAIAETFARSMLSCLDVFTSDCE